MSKVQAQMLRFVQAVDPLTAAGVEFALATVGTAAGKRFTAQRQLDIYNNARNVLQSQIHAYARNSDSRKLKGMEVSENMTVTTTLAFASGVASKPSGLMETILLTDASNNIIPVVPAADIDAVLDIASASNPVVVDYGTTYKDISGGTYVGDASTYKLYYVSVSTFVLSDVTGGTTNETFNEKWDWALIEIASAIANEMGEADVLKLVRQVVERVMVG